MEKFDKTNPYNPNAKKTYSKKTLILVALFTSIFFILLIAFAGGGSSKIGNYTKEALPKDFAYVITKDESDVASEKNQLEVELNQKLTTGQIATLAEELFNSKDKQRRFYIVYKLKGRENSPISWANSDFDPELKIQINGSTIEQDSLMLVEAKKVTGNIKGIFSEQNYTFADYTIYEKENKIFIKTAFKDGQTSDVELLWSKNENGIRYDYKNGGYNGEYFILTNNNILEFYNKENTKFTACNSIN
jgi:hypothetical protein